MNIFRSPPQLGIPMRVRVRTHSFSWSRPMSAESIQASKSAVIDRRSSPGCYTRLHRNPIIRLTRLAKRGKDLLSNKAQVSVQNETHVHTEIMCTVNLGKLATERNRSGIRSIRESGTDRSCLVAQCDPFANFNPLGRKTA
jgi:hypothetical protein